ncbi:MAG: elongation factor 4, partial [Planctomycetes bacterium]|nr:elongation factor 4 [Planctomycetota bacterium]
MIRNFCIIAHIDHGKSTLADRMLEVTRTVSAKEMKNQILDDMDLERERGITIKAHAIRMNYEARDNRIYELNLIDTPGHVDFTYEVSRSLAACEGAILVIDSTQGVEAQTVGNLLLALENNLVIIPVVNKIDMPAAQIEETKRQISDLLGIDGDDIIEASAKQGLGIVDILEAVVERIPAPTGDVKKPLKALIFDSSFDSYRGAVPYIRVFDGSLKPGMQIKFFATNGDYEVDEVGLLRLGRHPVRELQAGEVGYVIGSFKNLADTKVGDTITDRANPATEALPGYRDVKPMVFSGIFPIDSDNYENLKLSLEKLKLNDASLVYEPETSAALGFGFRCG